MNVTLREVLAGAEQHAVPLTAECVGYLVLGAADQVLGAPRSVGTEDLLLSEDGAVRVAGGRAARADEAERDLRAVLDALLMPASSASAGLLRASRRPPGTGIEGLVRELETALIPVNRSAAKRALSRLQRETRRALESGRIRVDASVPPPAPSAAAEPSVAPPAVRPAPPVVEALPSHALELAPSEPLPSVALPPVATELAPAVSAVAATSAVASVASTTMALNPLAEQHGHTQMLAPVAPVAPREPAAPLAPQLVETRPEPVVRRASQRPAPPPLPIRVVEEELAERGHTMPLPPVVRVDGAAAEHTTRDTPVLGTRVSAEPVGAEAVSIDAEALSIDSEAVSIDAEAVSIDESDESALDISVIVEARPDVAGAAPLDAASSEDDDGLIEVIFEDEVRPLRAEEHEPVVVEPPAPEASETTDPCPPLAAESMLPPPCEIVTAAPPPSVVLRAEPAPSVAEPAPSVALRAEPAPSVAEPIEPAPSAAEPGEPLSSPAELVEHADFAEPATVMPAVEAVPPVEAEAETPTPATLDAETLRPAPPEAEAAGAPDVAPAELVPSDVGLAALVESALPPWTTAEPSVLEVTPPPRVALPTPRRSDVEALLGRLTAEPLGVDELRSGLKHLAGLDLTPPPPGTERDE